MNSATPHHLVSAWRSARARLAVAALCIGISAAAHAWPPLVTVDVYDRTGGGALAIHPKGGEAYVVGTPGHEYAIRIRNCSGGRILAVTSVDGVNVVSGDTASPEQSGYVIAAGDSVEIAGWRTSLERTSAFYFTDLGDSYAARTGRPANVGVIGVAVFRERTRPTSGGWLRDRIAAHEESSAPRGDAPSAPAAAAAQNAPRPTAAPGRSDSTQPRALASKIGTGFGRDESSYAERVAFERATTSPSESVSIQYDRRENLIAMGVLPAPRYAQRAPDPFPAMRFVPAPR